MKAASRIMAASRSMLVTPTQAAEMSKNSSALIIEQVSRKYQRGSSSCLSMKALHGSCLGQTVIQCESIARSGYLARDSGTMITTLTKHIRSSYHICCPTRRPLLKLALLWESRATRMSSSLMCMVFSQVLELHGHSSAMVIPMSQCSMVSSALACTASEIDQHVGGFPRWQAEGLPVEETEPAAIEPSNYGTPNSLASGSVRSYEQMTAADPAKDVILYAGVQSVKLV